MTGGPSRGFEIIEHTADVGIRVWGDSPAELFTAGAEAMFALIVAPGSVGQSVKKGVEVSASDWGALLFNWLDELLYLHEVEGFLLNRVESIRVEPYRVRAELAGETYDPTRHQILEQIKAVTFHGLEVVDSPIWSAQVIFDV